MFITIGSHTYISAIKLLVSTTGLIRIVFINMTLEDENQFTFIQFTL